MSIEDPSYEELASNCCAMAITIGKIRDILAESTATPGNMPTTPCQHTFKVFATAVMCTRCRCVYDLSE